MAVRWIRRGKQATPDVYRAAVEADLPALVDLADHRRQQYERYQPIFFRPAADAREKHAPYLRGLLTEKNVIAHVHEREDGVVDAFVIAMLVPAPPVYDPGGPTCLIDDFCVADSAE